MHRDDFDSQSPGQCLRAFGPSGDYWAFVPHPLPPALTFGTKTIRLVAEASSALGELNGLGSLLKNPRLVINPFLRREAVASSRIEGTVANFEQLLLFEAEPGGGDVRSDPGEVASYLDALELGLGRLDGRPISLHLIREMHGLLMRGGAGRDKRPGEFRDRQNMIGHVGQDLAGARFVPPPVAQMRDAMESLGAYLAAGSDLPTLIDVALIHYQFEAIHPFLDGNGRIGRVLILLLLQARGELRQPILALSDFFERNRRVYVDRLLGVSLRGEWIEWIEFFLGGVAEQSRLTVSRSRRLMALQEQLRARAAAVARSNKAQELIDHLFHTPALTIARAADRLGVTEVTAATLIRKLEVAGILREVTGRARNRIYLAPEILEAAGGPDDVGRAADE